METNCEINDKILPRADSVNRQNKKNIEADSFACTLCNVKLSGASQLKKHETVHTGETPYACNQCAKSFSPAGDLTKHKRVHTGETPFACNRCVRNA